MHQQSGGKRFARRAILLAAIGTAGVTQHARAANFSATWTGAIDGTWTNPARWSTNPNFPNNGLPSAGDTYDAIIGATGASYTATLNSNITVNSLVLGAASVTLSQTAGTFRAINGLSLQTGTFQLNGGTLLSTTVSASGGVLTFGSSGGNFDGVTLDTDVTVTNANLSVFNGLAFNSRTLSFSSSTQQQHIGLPVASQSFSGVGTIVFDGSRNDSFIGGNFGTLTLGSGMTIRTSAAGGFINPNGLINNGTISAQTSGKILQFGSPNNGVSTNNGTLQATAGTLDIAGTVTVGGLGTIRASGGTVQLSGKLLNTGNTLNLTGPAQVLYLNDGTIAGGTIATSAGGTLNVTAGTTGHFDAVTLDTDLTVSNAHLAIFNGMAFNNRTLTLSGATQEAALTLPTTSQSWSGAGTIVFDGSRDDSFIGGNFGTLTLGSGITIRTGTAGGSINPNGLVNNGTVLAQTGGKTLTFGNPNNGVSTNNGTLEATAGTLNIAGTITAGGLGTFKANGGTVQLSGTLLNSGNTLNLTGTSQTLFLNNGTITGGTLTTSGGGTLNVTSGTTGHFDGITLDTDLTLNSTHLSIFNGLTFNNRTLTLNAVTQEDALGLPVASQTWSGAGTVVFNGSRDDSVIGGNFGTLTLGPAITILTGSAGGIVSPNGLINNGTILAQTLGKTLTIGTNNTVFSNNGTLQASNSGKMIVTFQPTNYVSGTLTGGHYYVFGGSSISLGFAGSITTNAADVRLDGVGSTFTPINSLATNNGTLTIANGRSFGFAGAITNNGQITAASGGTITIPGGANNGTIDCQAGATIVFNGSFNHGSTSFLNGSGNVIFNGGTQAFNGTITGNIDLSLLGAANFGALSRVTSTKPFNTSGNSLLSPGASVSFGGLNFFGGSSPAIAIGADTSVATLALSGDVTVANVTGTSQIANAGTSGLSGVLNLGGNRTFTVNNNNASPDLLISAAVTNGSITENGGGLLELTNSNSYTGGTTIIGGSLEHSTVQISNAHALGTGPVTFADGTLDVRSDAPTTSVPNALRPFAPTNSIYLNVDRITSGAAGVFQFPASTLGANLNVSGAGTAQFAGASLVSNTIVRAANTVEFTGPLTGNFGVDNAGTGTAIFSGSTPNTYTGLTQVHSGTLILNKSASVTAIPGDLQILGGIVKSLASDQIADSATVTVTNGTLEVDGSGAPASLILNGGTLTGSGDVTITSQFIYNGGRLSGSGILTIASGATANINGSPTLGRNINNSGTFNLANGMEIGTSGVDIDSYTLSNLAGGVMNVTSGTIENNNAGFATFNNSGTINKTGPDTFRITDNGSPGITFTNSGTVSINGGTLSIAGNSTINSGTITIPSGSALNIGSAALLAGSSLRGSGAVTFTGGMNTIAAGVFTPQGPVSIDGGTVEFDGPQTFASLTLNGSLLNGALAGNGDVTVTNLFAYDAGILSGSSALNIAAGATANINYYPAPRGVINNSGTFNLADGLQIGINGYGSDNYTFNNPAGGVVNVTSGDIQNNNGGIGTFNNSGTINKTGGGTLNIADNVSGGAMSFTNSGTVSIIAGLLQFSTSSLVTTGTISVGAAGILRFNRTFSNSGTISLSGGGIIADYSSTSPLSTIVGQIKTGFAGGGWSGPGINSAAAANDPAHHMGVGYAEASALGVNSFLGQTVDGSTVLARYTFLGDANLDGQVNTLDFTRLAQNFNSTNKLWSDGDFNYDGTVNALDFSYVATNFGAALPGTIVSLGAFVPEPCSIGLLAPLLMLTRRRRA